METYLLPDFASYPIEHRVADAQLLSGGVRVTWDDGEITDHHRLCFGRTVRSR